MHIHPFTITLLARERQRRLLADARSARVRKEIREVTAARRAQHLGITSPGAASPRRSIAPAPRPHAHSRPNSRAAPTPFITPATPST